MLYILCSISAVLMIILQTTGGDLKNNEFLDFMTCAFFSLILELIGTQLCSFELILQSVTGGGYKTNHFEE